jgi:hypothetical protein
MKTYGGVEAELSVFLTLALDGDEWLVSWPGRFIPGEKSPIPTEWGGLVGPIHRVDVVAKRKDYYSVLNKAKG